MFYIFILTFLLVKIYCVKILIHNEKTSTGFYFYFPVWSEGSLWFQYRLWISAAAPRGAVSFMQLRCGWFLISFIVTWLQTSPTENGFKRCPFHERADPNDWQITQAKFGLLKISRCNRDLKCWILKGYWLSLQRFFWCHTHTCNQKSAHTLSAPKHASLLSIQLFYTASPKKNGDILPHAHCDSCTLHNLSMHFFLTWPDYLKWNVDQKWHALCWMSMIYVTFEGCCGLVTFFFLKHTSNQMFEKTVCTAAFKVESLFLFRNPLHKSKNHPESRLPVEGSVWALISWESAALEARCCD